MLSLSLTRLRHILAVARTGSFSLAADEEGISQPALSRSIQAFEAQYDLILFDRNRGRITLTPAGKLAVRQARNTLAAATELDRSMSLFNKGDAGRIGIGLGPLLASILLPAIGKSLLRSSPLLQLVTRIRPADQLFEALVEGEIEAIFGNEWHLHQIPGVERVRIGSLPLAMAVRTGHPAATQGKTMMSELAPYPVAGAIEQPVSAAPAQAGAFVCDNFHILRDVVMGSDCVWLTSPIFIASDLEEGRLALLDIPDLQASSTDIWLATLRGRTRSPALEVITGIVSRLLSN